MTGVLDAVDVGSNSDAILVLNGYDDPDSTMLIK